MKGEHIAAELVGLVGIIVYGLILQHIYAELMNKPDTSWLNQLRAWWVTRGSRAMEKRLHEVWDRKDTAEEPSPE